MSQPRLSFRGIATALADYGMLGVLVLRCGLFTALSVQDQALSPAAAARPGPCHWQ